MSREPFTSGGYALLPMRFSAVLWLAAMSWVFWYVPRTPQPLLSSASLAIQFAAIGLIYAWVDHLLAGRRMIPFLLAGLMSLLAMTVVADAVVLSLTSASLRQSLTMMINTGDVWSALTESTISTGQATMLIAASALVFCAGGALHQILPRLAILHPAQHRVGIAGLALLVSFVGEQLHSRSTSSYLLRSTVMPMYARMASAPPDSGYAVAIPPPPGVERRLSRLSQIQPPVQPLNVVYILLESLRSDAINETVAPNLSALRMRSMNFVDAHANAILTLPSWNQLLFDRPPFTMADDVRATHSDELGAWPLEMLHAAGYSVRLSIADDIRLYDYDRRLAGRRGAVGELFIADQPGRAAGTAEDALATDRAIEWIAQSPSEPFFILLELASTHWTYSFDEDRAIIEPYAQAMLPMHVRSQPELDLLRNRYFNALHQVDEHVGRVLEAIERAGIASRTLIVVTGDHGEGFMLGRVGHSILNNDTRKVPLMFAMPGIGNGGPTAVQRAQIPVGDVRGVTPHSTIWPMIFHLIGVNGVREEMLAGRLSLGLDMDHGVALTFDGSLEYASLTFPQYVIEFKVKESAGTLTFTPIGVTDREGGAIEPFDAELRAVPWQKALDCLIRRQGCDDVAVLRYGIEHSDRVKGESS